MKEAQNIRDALLNKNTQEQAFRQLMQQYKEPLYWHIRKIVVRHEDAEDVLQNTFIKIFQNIKNFKGNSKLYTWFYRIATNESLKLLQKNARIQETSWENVQQSRVQELASDPYFDGDAMQRKLQEAITRLPYKQQLVFNMKYFDNMKYQSIAEILETSVGGLKANYHHAVTKIKRYLEEN